MSAVLATLATPPAPARPNILALAFDDLRPWFLPFQDSSIAAPSFLPATALPALPALAFENRLPPDEVELKYKSPRSPGPKPTDIGAREDGGLKPCLDGKPHCFSSTPEYIEDNDLFNADTGASTEWLVRPFKYDKPMAAALLDLKTAIASYPPGQNGIDGGGFKLITENTKADRAYLYVQFESLRRGYIDDMEFSLKDGVVQVRTS